MQNLTFFDIIKLFKKWWWIIVLITTLITGTVGYISFFKLTPIYANTSTILINDRGDGEQKTSLTFSDVMLYEKLMGTYKDIIKSKLILNDVGKALSPKMTSEQLEPIINISSNANSQVFRITVENANYVLATKIANLVAETFNEKVKPLMTVDNVRILDPAEIKENPVPIKPRKKFNITLAFIFSFFVSLSITLLIHLLDTRIRTEEDLTGISSFPIIGSIPDFNRKNSKGIYQ